MGLEASQRLNIALRQQGKLSPKLQQSIKLLAYNYLDLRMAINQMLAQNVMLEQSNDLAFEEDFIEEAEESDSADATLEFSDGLEHGSTWEEDYDSDWKDGHNERDYNYEQYLSENKTLNQSLIEQLYISSINTRIRDIAIILIDEIDSDGYLRKDIDLLVAQYPYTKAEIRKAVKALQNCEPNGIAAFDLQECLLLQIATLNKKDEGSALLQTIVQNHFYDIRNNDAAILKMLNIDAKAYKRCLNLLSTLNARPASSYHLEKSPYIIPEIIVKEKNGINYITMKGDSYPSLSINREYADLMNTSNKKDKIFLKEQMAEATWFINALEKRNDTIRRIATAIVSMQQGFFAEGEKAMQVFTRQQLSEMLNLHESTISRAVTGKYLQCSRGVFELSYFFSSALDETQNDAPSTTAIKAQIAEIIDNENKKKPFSDQKISELLAKKSIILARRTVTKYRKKMNISVASIRKSNKSID